MKPGKDFVGVGVGAFIVRDGRLLLLKRKKAPEKGSWMIPGGKVELGQSLEEAVKKEVREELGVECTIRKLLCVADQILPEEGVHFVAPTFLVDIKGKPSIQEPKKHAELRWFPIENLPRGIAKVNRPAVKEYRELLEKEKDFYELVKELIETEPGSVKVKPKHDSDLDKILTWLEGFGFEPYKPGKRERK